MSAREFIQWQAYYRLDPFGTERVDIAAGTVAATIANVNRGKSQRAFKIEEFIPRFGPPKVQSNAEMAAVLSAFASAVNSHG